MPFYTSRHMNQESMQLHKTISRPDIQGPGDSLVQVLGFPPPASMIDFRLMDIFQGAALATQLIQNDGNSATISFANLYAASLRKSQEAARLPHSLSVM